LPLKIANVDSTVVEMTGAEEGEGKATAMSTVKPYEKPNGILIKTQ